MRVLVISDAHGAITPVLHAVEDHPEAKEILYLGDGVAPLEDLPRLYPARRFTFIKGNNDFGCDCPDELLLEFDGVRVLAVHGHRHGVGWGTGGLLTRALQLGARAAVYGHTHVAEVRYEQGVTLLCPGSVARPRQGKAAYGALDITPAGLVPLLFDARP